MKKITTLYKKDPTNLGLVINEKNPENQWVFDGDGIATRKFDGTSCAIKDEVLYKRYDVKLWKKKKGKITKFTPEQLTAKIPSGAIACQEPDKITGHWPHWIKCDRSKPEDKYHFEAFNLLQHKENATYELCGPKIQNNSERFHGHILIRHGKYKIDITDYSFDAIRNFLKTADIEGIVFHHKSDGRMCKIRKTDFGLTR
jgi:hypothetical protein